MIKERKEILKKHLPNVTDLWISVNEGILDAMEEYADQIRKEAIDEAVRDNVELREMLWVNHGCGISALYGDDGEMQCHKCMIDFKRMKPEDIQAIWRKDFKSELLKLKDKQ